MLSFHISFFIPVIAGLQIFGNAGQPQLALAAASTARPETMPAASQSVAVPKAQLALPPPDLQQPSSALPPAPAETPEDVLEMVAPTKVANEEHDVTAPVPIEKKLPEAPDVPSAWLQMRSFRMH